MKAIFYAFLAAVFYVINIPASKVLLRDVGPTTMAALLDLGAGIGIAILSLLNVHDRKASAPLTRRHEAMPSLAHVAAALALGFVAYGLSIFLYVRAQNTLGAAKTSAYYAVAPFVGALLSFVLLKEGLSWMYLAALGVMVAGAALVVVDTLVRHHTHPHQHTFTHFHGGYVHTHTITHTHGHDHLGADGTHSHRHSPAELERELVDNLNKEAMI